MSWFSELAGKAENLLNNLDEQTGAALGNHVSKPKKHDKNDISNQALHDNPWTPKKRPMPRNLNNISPIVDTRTRSTVSPTRKYSTTPMFHISRSSNNDENHQKRSHKAKTSPNRTPILVNDSHKGTNSVVRDVKCKDVYYSRNQKRRNSLPATLEALEVEDLILKTQTLEVENSVLKSEITVMSKEVSVLTNRLQDYEKDAKINLSKLENLQTAYDSLEFKKETYLSQIQQLKQNLHDVTNNELIKHQKQNEELNDEINILTEKNKSLEDKIEELNRHIKEEETSHNKLKNELKHAQTVINELQTDLGKSNEERYHLEKDWESYKLRVKNMLLAKDGEIKALRQGISFDEDNKMLMDQLDQLKEERAALSESLSSLKRQCEEASRQCDRAESQRAAAERVAAALRDALRDERAAKNKAEAHCLAIAKELKTLQIETSQTIAGLRNALYEKQDEINKLHVTCSSSIPSADTSALNVADYEVMREDNEKIQYLTKTLVQRQNRVDSLVAENNMLKIQLDKLETKFKNEMASLKQSSILSVQEAECRRCRSRTQDATPLSWFSVRLGLMCRRHPLFRIFILAYMIVLHFWVLTVLFTNTPQDLYKPVMSV